MSIPRRITGLRKKRGWSQTDLAHRMGISTSFVSRFENPRYKSLTLSTLRRIAAALDVKLEVFLKERDGQKNDRRRDKV